MIAEVVALEERYHGYVVGLPIRNASPQFRLANRSSGHPPGQAIAGLGSTCDLSEPFQVKDFVASGTKTALTKALHEAIELGDLDAVERNLALGADPDGGRDSSVFNACALKRWAVLEVLLANGASPSPSNCPTPPAKVLAGTSGVEGLRILLKNGADPNAGHAAALAQAVRSARPECVQVLLRFGADPRLLTDGDWSRLQLSGNTPEGRYVHTLLESRIAALELTSIVDQHSAELDMAGAKASSGAEDIGL